MAVATSSASSGPSSSSGKVGKASVKRLQSELMQLMMSGDKDATAFPQGDNLFEWVGTLTGANGTVYEGLTYKTISEVSCRLPILRTHCLLHLAFTLMSISMEIFAWIF